MITDLFPKLTSFTQSVKMECHSPSGFTRIKSLATIVCYQRNSEQKALYPLGKQEK